MHPLVDVPHIINVSVLGLKAETFVEKLFQRAENRAEKKKIEESLDYLKRCQSRRKIQIRARKRGDDK